MKKLILMLVCGLMIFAMPIVGQGQVPLLATWDVPPDSDLAGCRLYASITSGSYEYGSASPNLKAEVLVPESQAIFEVPGDGKTWYVVATAFDNGGNESGPSSEASVTVPDLPPGEPTNLQIMIQLTQKSDGSYAISLITVDPVK